MQVAAVHNPFAMQIPAYVESVITDAADDDVKKSLTTVDNRDDRVISPFQNWLVEEIMANVASSINVLTERGQVMPPSCGFQMSLFANYTLDGVKAVLLMTVGSQTGGPCARWDSRTADALSHEAFQPFVWPMMRSSSATYVDVKFFNGNEVLFHWVLRGYRSDSDLSVQQQFCDEMLIRDACQGRFRPSIVVAVFQGWTVSVFSFEVGGRSYSVGPNGTVLAGDHCRCNGEVRVTDRSSIDGIGNDADRVEFRYRDSDSRIDLKCGRVSVPGTWLAVSHISGPALIQTITHVRAQRARVECLDQTQQFAQLAAHLDPWWVTSKTRNFEEVGVQVTNFPMDEEALDFRLRARSKLFVMQPEYVDPAALAHRTHIMDEAMAAPLASAPPAIADAAAAADAQQLSVDRSTRSALADQDAGSVAPSFDQRTSDVQAIAGANNKEWVQPGELRDMFRADMNVSRTSAAITPKVFWEFLSPRRLLSRRRRLALLSCSGQVKAWMAGPESKALALLKF